MQILVRFLSAFLSALAAAHQDESRRSPAPPYPEFHKRSTFLTNTTSQYAVDGTAIPNVPFDIGESYAGLLPITPNGTANSTDKLYFWFFPTTNPAAGDEILIWLNGGPGCSSLLGFLDENGPFTWKPGTYQPNQNEFSWVNLTNVIWIDQPIGTGFSPGKPTAKNENDIAAQFQGFWKNLVQTFDLQGWKIYIAGESYAGRYVPYIADAFLNSNDTTNFNLQGTMLNDALISEQTIQYFIPEVPYVNYWNQLWKLNDTFIEYINDAYETCGYSAYLDEYLQYPPPTTHSNLTVQNCSYLSTEIQAAITLKNPCFDLFQITNDCPLLWDVIPPPAYPGYPVYNYSGTANSFFNDPGVKQAINAPVNTYWEECTNRNVFVHGIDNSPPPDEGVYQRVIERSNRTVLAHGALDMILVANGTKLAIQRMTWNGAKGFTSEPSDQFYVPPSTGLNVYNQAGSGVFGTTHTERGLTYVEVDLAGHMIPQFAPAAAYRYLEFLLGRIDSLNSTVPFTTL